MIADLWRARARLNTLDAVDDLRRVLDPADRQGVKNAYLDTYLKQHLLEGLRPRPADELFEIGSGTGRLVEYLAPRVRAAYGTDLVDEFINTARAAAGRHANAHYLTRDEFATQTLPRVNSLYAVWVLMCFESDDALVETLRWYRERLPGLQRAVVIDQVKERSSIETYDGTFYCRYRTPVDYRKIFEAAGFVVEQHRILPERNHAPIYSLLRLGGRLLPRVLVKAAPALFAFDRRVMGFFAHKPEHLICNRVATDAMFELSVA